MTRVKRGNSSRYRHKKKLKMSKGFRGASSKLFRTANQQLIKSLKYSYRDRRQKKRDFRENWINRLNAILRYSGINYNSLIFNNNTNKILFNRKVLSQIALYDSNAFTQYISKSFFL
uniref:Large ribosomal subunit protein bL20c n=1 Tax=Dichotomosiphon tuberosus TaxID=118263 RepID=A0A386AWQ8_9CHLO|nr:ribosomal protein L20 [Dichotomosiphon tuberosus]